MHNSPLTSSPEAPSVTGAGGDDWMVVPVTVSAKGSSWGHWALPGDDRMQSCIWNLQHPSWSNSNCVQSCGWCQWPDLYGGSGWSSGIYLCSRGSPTSSLSRGHLCRDVHLIMSCHPNKYSWKLSSCGCCACLLCSFDSSNASFFIGRYALLCWHIS